VEILTQLIEANDLKAIDLAEILGIRPRVSNILAGKLAISERAKRLGERFRISQAAFIPATTSRRSALHNVRIRQEPDGRQYRYVASGVMRWGAYQCRGLRQNCFLPRARPNTRLHRMDWSHPNTTSTAFGWRSGQDVGVRS
jgi:hypothetical protein